MTKERTWPIPANVAILEQGCHRTKGGAVIAGNYDITWAITGVVLEMTDCYLSRMNLSGGCQKSKVIVLHNRRAHALGR